jgi:hypothetical protein
MNRRAVGLQYARGAKERQLAAVSSARVCFHTGVEPDARDVDAARQHHRHDCAGAGAVDPARAIEQSAILNERCDSGLIGPREERAVEREGEPHQRSV